MNKDVKMFANKIEIPLSMIKKLGWENNDTILRLTIEDNDLLMIGKTKSVDEVVESINKTIPYNPEEYWKDYWEKHGTKYQLPRPIHDAVIQDTLKELIDRTDLLESRMLKMEKRH